MGGGVFNSLFAHAGASGRSFLSCCCILLLFLQTPIDSVLVMAAEGGKDRLGDIADDLLQHVLSRLPLDDALRTCVLDTRWCELWRRTTSLHINAYHCQRLQ
ncbi:hypothetical protein VPH35_102787 [Triticum aestivum]